MRMERFTVSMYENDIDLFERIRGDLSLNKSAFIRFLLMEYTNKTPSEIKHKKLIKEISDLNTEIKKFLLQDKLNDSEKLYIYEKLNDINAKLCANLAQSDMDN